MTTALATLKLDKDIKDRLKKLGEARDRTPHWLMVDAVKSYVEREEKREAFRSEVLKDYEQYQRDGLHVTDEEANAWLNQLANGLDVEPPACHV
jgi:predicted transcriptional regulator